MNSHETSRFCFVFHLAIGWNPLWISSHLYSFENGPNWLFWSQLCSDCLTVWNLFIIAISKSLPFQILPLAHLLTEVMGRKTLACFLLQVHNQHNISRRRHLQCMYIYFPGSWAGSAYSAFWKFMVHTKKHVSSQFFLQSWNRIRFHGYRG